MGCCALCCANADEGHVGCKERRARTTYPDRYNPQRTAAPTT